MQLIDRFLRYVTFDTQSDDTTNTVPSTAKQLVFGRELVEDLKKIGVSDAHIDEFGVVYGTLPGNVADVPVIGFIAHMDTSMDVSGANVAPRIIEHYDGMDIILDEAAGIVTKPSVFPSLANHVGKTLIVTDGKTLLGADDKAGLAEIMDLIQFYHNHPEVQHGTIKVAFTPDEEIGQGADHFDVKKFGADFAFTLDGGDVSVVEYENFNAASADVVITGTNTHPGSAKHKMVNAIHLGMQFHSLLPVFDNPAYTEGYEGFNHLNEMEGNVEKTTLHYIIRNHDKTKFAQQKKHFEQAAAFMNERYPNAVSLTIKDSYANMKENLLNHMHVVDMAMEAIQQIGLTPRNEAIRGGTDGARLTYMGLPCPNLGTGGYVYHSRHEYAVVEEMQQAVEVLKQIIASSLKTHTL